MNNKGWGLQEMIVLCALLIGALILVVVIVVTNFFGLIPEKASYGSTIDETRTYNSMELEMISASKKYVKKYYDEDFSDSLYIKVSSLQGEKMLSSLYDVKDAGIECSGYVKAAKINDELRYEPYMKCGSKYTTTGYESKYDG